MALSFWWLESCIAWPAYSSKKSYQKHDSVLTELVHICMILNMFSFLV